MPSTVSDVLLKPAVKFYQRRILKDPFQLAVRQWKCVGGDRTLRLDYPLSPQSVVLDVGGYQGDFAQAIVDKYGCRVVVFEPMPAFAEHCRSRFVNVSNVSVLEFGLGSKDEQLCLSDSADASSFFHDSAIIGVTAEMRDIATVWHELAVTRVALMKINIEGGEYPLLSRMIECGLVDRVDNIQVQFHNFVDRAAEQRDRIREQLRQTHDETWCFTFVWENWQRRGGAA